MQLLAKFKKILYMGFRATLKFSKIKGGPEPYMCVQNILKAKSGTLSCLSKFDINKKIQRAVFER